WLSERGWVMKNTQTEEPAFNGTASIQQKPEPLRPLLCDPRFSIQGAFEDSRRKLSPAGPGLSFGARRSFDQNLG
ncbi:MAG: hypothetical protein ABSD98_19265, partial [Candidatus Korobacteraceae bacterium]